MCLPCRFNKIAGLKTCIFNKIGTKLLKQFFYRTPLYYIFPKIYVMIDVRYFRVVFCYCKIRPRKRKNFPTDRSKFPVKT